MTIQNMCILPKCHMRAMVHRSLMSWVRMVAVNSGRQLSRVRACERLGVTKSPDRSSAGSIATCGQSQKPTCPTCVAAWQLVPSPR